MSRTKRLMASIAFFIGIFYLGTISTDYIDNLVYALNLSRVKTWGAEVLTHTDLNAEFDNIISHSITNTDISAAAAISASKIDGLGSTDSPTFAGLTLGGNIISDTDSTDDLGTSSISWANTYTDAIHLNKIGTNTLFVGAGGDYTTISLAMTAATSGDTILVSEGTYTEAVTFSQDNITLRALGSAENTIITQVAADVVAFGASSGCTLDGFTVSITAADAATDNCITSGNDAATGAGFNTIENCIITWDSSTAAGAAECGIVTTAGDTIIRNNRFTITQTQASTAASGIEAIHFVNADFTHYVYNNIITTTNATTTTSGNSDKGIYLVGGSSYIFNNVIIMSNTGQTNHETLGLNLNAGVAGVNYVIGNTIKTTCSSTGKATCLYLGNSVGSEDHIIGNKLHSTTGDGDGIWMTDGKLVYATGNIVTGDANYTAGTTNYVHGNNIKGKMVYGGGDDVANTLDVFFTSGFGIALDDLDAQFDNASHGDGTTTMYIGNDTIAFSFTGKHHYQLGDTDLESGEVVSLKNGRIYRTTEKQDPTAIGIYQGVTSKSNSMGEVLVEPKETDEEYDKYDDVEKKWKKKIRKKKDYKNKVSSATGQPVQPLDFAYSVAIVGDSYEEHDKKPLLGAWVTTDAGNIKNGDYLCSSNKSGYLEKQGTNTMMNYTIAKAREDINSDCKDAYIYLLQ